MTATKHYDAIVIGAGQAGGPLSTALAQAGWRTAIIERIHVGGTCINEGCTPTKTMVASARVAYLARRALDYGVDISGEKIDLPAVIRRKQKIVDEFREGSAQKIQEGGVEIIKGQASFTSPTSIRVTHDGELDLEVTAREFFINTGGR